MSPWSWALSLGFAALFLLLPLSGVVMPGIQDPLRGTALLPSDALWSPGPLHTAHQSIGNRCDACHVKPFEPVRDHECFVCHASVQHHVDIKSTAVALFQDTQCTACHMEHKQPAALVQREFASELLRLYTDQKWTVLFVTHSVAEAVFLSTRIVILAAHPGRVAHEIKVNLPWPRTAETRESKAFEEQITQASRLLRGVYQP